jgi:Protein of unknown function (DUF974)
MSFPLKYRVSQAGTYYLTTEVSYSSKYFTEQYNLQLASARPGTIPTNLRTAEHEVTDTIRKIITKKQKKSVKFDVLSPVDNIQKKIELVNNSYFVQIQFQNPSVSKIFIESVEFKSKFDVLKVQDLNTADGLSLYS